MDWPARPTWVPISLLTTRVAPRRRVEDVDAVALVARDEVAAAGESLAPLAWPTWLFAESKSTPSPPLSRMKLVAIVLPVAAAVLP